MKSIFHPTDFTDASLTAFRHALRLSFGGELTVIHVHPKGAHGNSDGFPKVRDTLADWKANGLAIAHMPKVRKVESESAHVVAALEQDLRRHKADLVVLACHPREGIAAWLKPSVSQEFVRRTRAPALFVPQGVEGFVGEGGKVALNKVLIAVTDEPDPQIAVDAAARLFAALGANPQTIVALHVGEVPLAPAPVAPAPNALKAMTVQGDVVEAILGVAAQMSVDLIVMVSAGHDGFLDALRGSTTEQVIRRAPCPVLVESAPDYSAAPPV